jgi:glycosyltransferase involved in cell wall biosynthesis
MARAMMAHKEKSNPPLVSVIIPVYNCETYLAQTINSVLSQTHRADELIVVDDGSTDRSREIVLNYPEIKYIYQENSGAAEARNRGIKESHGNYLAFLDSDDLWMPEKLFLQIKVFSNDPSLDIVTGHVEQFVSPDMDPQIASRYAYPDRPLIGYSPSAIKIKRSALAKTGLFHEDFQGGEAISWFANVFERDVNIFILPDIISRRRIHGNNLSIRKSQGKEKTITQILKLSLDRRRARKRTDDDK